MAQATEVVFLPLKEDTDTRGQKFKSTLETIIKQGGPLRMYAGAQVEHPKVFNMFIDWSSIGHHEEFMKWE